MAVIAIKGHEFNAFDVKGSSSRRAVLFRNNIIENLKKIGVDEDYIDIPLEAIAIKRAPASASWYFDGHNLYFSYKAGNFIENLYVVSKVIELEVNSLLNGIKNMEEFITDFSEDRDIEIKRKEARELLGVHKNSLDMNEISKKYKILAKENHPDLGGSTERFQAINNAHNILKRELL
ncbi:MAG: J domain-containing protein [Nanoarchaeota archaeon]